MAIQIGPFSLQADNFLRSDIRNLAKGWEVSRYFYANKAIRSHEVPHEPLNKKLKTQAKVEALPSNDDEDIEKTSRQEQVKLTASKKASSKPDINSASGGSCNLATVPLQPPANSSNTK